MNVYARLALSPRLLPLAVLSWLLCAFACDAAAGAQSASPLQLISSDGARVVVELSLADYEQRTLDIAGTRYSALSIAQFGHTNTAGLPQLPIKGALIGVPYNADVSMRVLDDDVRRDTLAFAPLPAARAEVQYEPAQPLPRYIGNVIAPAAVDALYPAQAVRLVGVSEWRSQRVAQLEFAPLQYEPAARALLFHRRLRVELTFRNVGDASVQTLGAAVDEGAFEGVLAQNLLNYASARNWRRAAPTLRAPSAASASAPAYKVAVDADGLYRITCAQLASAGVDLNTLDPRTLKLQRQGSELAMLVAGDDWRACNASNHYLEFFGQAARTRYTDTNLYWLTFGGANGKRMQSRASASTGALAANFAQTVRVERNWQYISYLPFVEGADHWYSYNLPNAYDPDGNGDPNSAEYTFAATGLDTSAATASVQLRLFGFSYGAHHTQTFINGNLVDDALWSGRNERVATVNFPVSYLNGGINTIRVSELEPAPNAIYIRYFDVTYPRAYRTADDTLRFTQSTSGAWQFQLSNFSDAAIDAFDISDAWNVTRIVNGTVSQSAQYEVYLPLVVRPGAASVAALDASRASTPTDVRYTLRFGDTASTPREYLAVTNAQRKTPRSITLDSASNLRSSANGADYILITHAAFAANVQPLATLRQNQGLRVQVVDVQDIYDEFSDGLMDAQAIRDFLQYAYNSWQAPQPQYVLLVGSGNFDFKNVYGTGQPTFIPPYLRLVDPWLGETASDNRLVAFNAGNPLPSMSIGRLPALTAAEVDAMVAKIIANEQSAPAGAWRSKVTFISDNAYEANGAPDFAGNFWNLSDSAASVLPNTFTAERIYYNPCSTCPLAYPAYTTDTSVRSALVGAINDGRLIVNYVGHSAIPYWAGEQLFRVQDVNALANDKWPVMLAMTCYDGYFHFPGITSLAVANVRLAGRGALASWSATGLGVSTGHDYLDRGFFNAVMQQGTTRLGPATVAAKWNLWLNSDRSSADLIDTFNLLGDPASRLALP